MFGFDRGGGMVLDVGPAGFLNLQFGGAVSLEQ